MKHFINIVLRALLLTLLSLQFGTQALAQWSIDPFLNNAISTAANDQYSSTITSDGAGGAIITWHDFRSGTAPDIYAQLINAAGAVQWTANGVPISTAADYQANPTITSDGAGGAIITWYDYRSGGSTTSDIYAQRINAAGVVQWTANGVAISTAANAQFFPTIVSDGVGGAIITWQDYRSSTNNDIYAQRINSAGAVQWTANGVAISTAANEQTSPAIVSDGAGGAIITWHDYRSGTNYDIYAQRINATGAVQWTANGVAISTAANYQKYPTIVSDGAGGAIITWDDYRSGTNDDVYAQRINAAGVVLWTANGVAISTAANVQVFPTIVSDGAGGAIITWYDYRSGTNYDIYAQRINASGVVQWSANGVAISIAASEQSIPTIVSDGAGGAIITWYDKRNGNYDIYTQRINAAGVVQWTNNGVDISTAANEQAGPTITSDGAGGAIITWNDQRSGNYDIYAQRIDRLGYLGIANPTLTKVKDVPGDQGGKVSVGWNASAYDVSGQQVATYYSIWRGIELNATVDKSLITTLDKMTMDFKGKAYRTLGSTNWELVGTMISHYFTSYSFTAPTLSDSTGSGTPYFKFLLSAHTSNQFVFWDSNIDSGYSVDNLAPSAVQTLAAQVLAGPNVKLTWDKNRVDPDVGTYVIHRSTINGFTPDQTTQLATSSDTTYTDNSPPSAVTVYYRVVTEDVHGNKSTPSQQAAATLANVPNSPTTLTAGSVSGSQINLTWQDNATDENGYKVERKTGVSGTFGLIATLPANSTSYTDNGLTDGTQYFYRVYAFNLAGNSDFSNQSNATTPMNAPTGLSASIVSGQPQLNWTDNSGSESGYKIERKTEPSGTYGEISTVGSGVNSYTDAGATAGYVYSYWVQGYNALVTSTFSNESSVAFTVTNQYAVANKWNMISVPLTVSDYSKAALFPTAKSNAFAYQGGYLEKDTLRNGNGYWLKFSGAQSVAMTGLVRIEETISVKGGWNMIGSISSPVPVNTITSTPPSLVTSYFFGYSEVGYQTSTTIEPSKVYWVKVSGAGTIMLSSAGNSPSKNRIRIVPTSEQPPASPEDE